MLQERNERRRNGNYLARRNVHVLNVLGSASRIVAAVAARNHVCGERAVALHAFANLADVVLVLVHGRKVLDLVGGLALFDFAIGSLKEAVVVDASVNGQRNNQADVGSFRSFDRTHASVVRIVNVADFEAGAVAGKSSRSQGVQAALVGKLGQGVDLVHELRQLRRAEEFFYGRDNRL